MKLKRTKHSKKKSKFSPSNWKEWKIAQKNIRGKLKKYYSKKRRSSKSKEMILRKSKEKLIYYNKSMTMMLDHLTERSKMVRRN
jgi:hypothetical protein